MCSTRDSSGWWTRHRGEKGGRAASFPLESPLPAMKAAPTPILGSFHQIGAQGIPFHITANGAEVLVILHRNRLEPALIQVSVAAAVTVSMTTLRVCQRQPTRKPIQSTIFPRPHHQMPMIRQHTTSQQPRLGPFHCLFQHPHKNLVVALFLKDPQPCVCTIEHVVNQAAIVCSFWSSHPHNLPNLHHPIKKQFLTTLLLQ